MHTPAVDLFIIGGGINGCGIARDAVGRGYSVKLAEMNDLASATSSASTKLFHGGLRYLEYGEVRLVREALIERETLLHAMPHISWPMRFVLPYHADMRFDTNTPASRLLAFIMPWMKGRRPAWMIRLGLFLYDNLGGRKILQGTKTLCLQNTPEGEPLKNHFKKAFEYSDCWVEDARLVVLNARDAAARGAVIMVQTKVTAANHINGLWHITTEGPDGKQTHTAKMIVNAGGPWVENLIHKTIRLNSSEGIRLVRGSHIVTKQLYDHNKCYFFQGKDGRIIFTIPYEDDFTLIGTTDTDHKNASTYPTCTPEETNYLINFVNEYLKQNLTVGDVVWTYSGVRPLYEDGASSASAATREYVLRVNTSMGGPVLTVFGGKITTYRKLAEAALSAINETLQNTAPNWTAGIAMPGGDFPVNGVTNLRVALAKQLPFLTTKTINRLIRQYGTEATHIFADIKNVADLGTDFGNGIFQTELDWAIANEWVRTGEDFLWRRSKLGLRTEQEQQTKIDTYCRKASCTVA